MVRPQPLADHAAQREAAEGEAAATGGIHHGQNVRRQLRHRIIARGRVGSAVAAGVEAQDLKALEQRRLRVPEAVIRPQSMGENQQGQVVPPFQTVVNPGVAGQCESAHKRMLTRLS